MATHTPTRITVQFRALAYMPDQVLITRHYGRGVPREFYATVSRPRGGNGYAVDDETWVRIIAERITDGPVTVLSPERTR